MDPRIDSGHPLDGPGKYHVLSITLSLACKAAKSAGFEDPQGQLNKISQKLLDVGLDKLFWGGACSKELRTLHLLNTN